MAASRAFTAQPWPCRRPSHTHARPAQRLGPCSCHKQALPFLNDMSWHTVYERGTWAAQLVSGATCLLLLMPGPTYSFDSLGPPTTQLLSHQTHESGHVSGLRMFLTAPAAREPDSQLKQQAQQKPQTQCTAPPSAATHQQDVAVALISSESIWYPLMLSAVAGLSTSIGGVIAVSAAHRTL